MATKRLRFYLRRAGSQHHTLGTITFRPFTCPPGHTLTFIPSLMAYPVCALQDADGNLREKWGATGIRVTDLAVTPDFARLVTVGIHHLPIGAADLPSGREAQSGDAAAAGAAAARASENRMIIYDLATKQIESCVHHLEYPFNSPLPLGLIWVRYFIDMSLSYSP